MDVIIVLGVLCTLAYIINLNLRIESLKGKIYRVQIKNKKQNDETASLCILMLMSYRPLYKYLEHNFPEILKKAKENTTLSLQSPSKFFNDIKKIKDIYGKDH